MDKKLLGKKIAILATNGVEEAELVKPREALENAGAKTVLISVKGGEIKAWNMNDWGEKYAVEETIENAKPEDFDGLMLPGGVMNPDKLRMNPDAVSFVRSFFEQTKPVAAICHAPWMLVEAGVVNRRTLTSWPSLQTDIENAGGQWVDEEVVVDKGLVTSRKPDDIPAFNEKMIEEFNEGLHPQQSATMVL